MGTIEFTRLFIDPARKIVRELESDVPMYGFQTVMEALDQSLWTRKAYSWLFGAFAMVAVLLSVAGIYGTVSYRVGQRPKEIGVRIAQVPPAFAEREVVGSELSWAATKPQLPSYHKSSVWTDRK